jgi:hypothetical protein
VSHTRSEGFTYGFGHSFDGHSDPSLIQQRYSSNSNFKRMSFFTVGHIAQVCSLVSSFHSSVVHAYARGLSRLGSLPPIFSHPPMIMRQYSPRLIMASQARMSKVSRAYCRPLSLSSRVNIPVLSIYHGYRWHARIFFV